MKTNMNKLILIAILIAITNCLYGSKSDVVVLTASNFQKEVTDSKDIWLIEFYGKFIT
jgi:hypothetical protein